jgi:predicted acetyltransferase
MAIEIRSPGEDGLDAAMRAGEAGFSSAPHEDDHERHKRTMPHDRFLAAFDEGRPVGTTGSYPFELTIPGGTLPAAGVTWVSVMPSHRRRGILTGFMRSQFDDLHERGEPLAILWASESAIYGRFGYGMAAPSHGMQADRARFGFADDPGAVGFVRLVDFDEALELFPPLYDTVRRGVPGMFARPEQWWREYKLADPEHWRRGAGPKFFAVYERDGRAEAYATYRMKHDWQQGIPRGELQVHDAFALTPTAMRELWRFLFGIDLVGHVKHDFVDPATPLPFLVADPRSLHLTVSDGLWLRVVDVEAALRARSYADGEPVVLEVRDEFCTWNGGRYRVGAEVERTEAEADLELGPAELASVYLGAFDFQRLAAAERVRELRPGALERATALFRTGRPPYCPEVF